jgi:hypothetical protein
MAAISGRVYRGIMLSSSPFISPVKAAHRSKAPAQRKTEIRTFPVIGNLVGGNFQSLEIPMQLRIARGTESRRCRVRFFRNHGFSCGKPAARLRA